MCLILFAIEQHPHYPLVVIANRDEFYARPAQNAHWWQDHPDVFAGRDLQAGGTWLGVNRRGRFAAVTNVREPGGMTPGALSRGDLPLGYLQGEVDAQAYLQQLQQRGASYSGFNLLFGDQQGLYFASNRSSGIERVSAGVYGVSNGGFDEDWPKLSSGREALSQAMQEDIAAPQLMRILGDNQIAADERLPSTGVELDIERMLSSRFIRSAEYGTRACSIVLADRDNRIHFYEQNYIDATHTGELVQETFEITREHG